MAYKFKYEVQKGSKILLSHKRSLLENALGLVGVFETFLPVFAAVRGSLGQNLVLNLGSALRIYL